MKVRRGVATLPVVFALLVLLAGCGFSGSGTTNGPSDQHIAYTNLHNKIPLVEHDPCSGRAHSNRWASCLGRYSAEIDGVAHAALGLAAHEPHPGALHHAAQALAAASSTFQRTCRSTAAPSCSKDLRTVDARLQQLGTVLNHSPMPGPPTQQP